MSHLSETIKALNPHVPVMDISDAHFSAYGKVITRYDFTPLIKIMEQRAIPAEGNIYTAMDDEMMACAVSAHISESFYGHMPIQIGYCNGNSSRLNALEYHKGTEIDIAVTDLVLLLGDVRDIRQNTLDAATVRAFTVSAGTACELYPTTLHFAPCKVSDAGFKSIIILPAGTNMPLSALPSPLTDEDRLLWMQNKWLISHPESVPASRGACAGIIGDNIGITY